ncbi:MAG TPA: hypothetical protein VJ965_01480, partial [Anaerolineales bacterium]|nr:hypothetical protein [Anaerolineales bacterium]
MHLRVIMAARFCVTSQIKGLAEQRRGGDGIVVDHDQIVPIKREDQIGLPAGLQVDHALVGAAPIAEVVIGQIVDEGAVHQYIGKAQRQALKACA